MVIVGIFGHRTETAKNEVIEQSNARPLTHACINMPQVLQGIF